MSDYWTNLYKEVQQGAKQYKKVKAHQDKIQGYLDDITKLHNVASLLLQKDVKASSELLKVAYEGAERLASKLGGNAPIISFFFRYHQPHIDVFANALRAKNEADFAINWQQIADRESKQIDKTVDDIILKYGFAGPMLSPNGILSPNLPRDFRIFCESTSYEIGGNDDKESFYKLSQNLRTRRWMEYEQKRLGQIILSNARDVSGAYLAVANEVKKFVNSAIKANDYFRKLNKSDNGMDLSIGGLANYFMQTEAFSSRSAGGAEITEVQMFTNGNLINTPSFKRTAIAYRKVRKLSDNWRKWAELVVRNDHMHMYY